MTKADVIKKWIAKAHHDFKIAIDELNTAEPVLDMVGFHLQQFIDESLQVANELKTFVEGKLGELK